jgi:hypothetical protein
MISLRDISGLWRRTLLAWPDGRTDTETAVFWLQGPRRYADLRVPAGRPTGSGVTCLRDLDWTMLRAMARQECFFGHLDIADSVACWHRAFDFQPATGRADRGTLAFEGGILVERGIEFPYIEHWVREAGRDEAMALSLTTEAGVPGCLIVAGDAFIYGRGRATPLPAGATLTELIDGAASLKAAQDLFDCEISFGRRRTGDKAGDWRIECSSHGFREGAALSPTLDSVNGLLCINDVTPDGARFERVWRITEQESTADDALMPCFDLEAVRGAMPDATPETHRAERLGAWP